MKKITKEMLGHIADALSIAASHMGRQATAAREQGFPDLAAACISKATEYEKLAGLFRQPTKPRAKP